MDVSVHPLDLDVLRGNVKPLQENVYVDPVEVAFHRLDSKVARDDFEVDPLDVDVRRST